MKNENQGIRQIVDMPEWEGVLDALLSCDPGHADLIETLIRNLKPVESAYDKQNQWMDEYQAMMKEMEEL